MVKSNEDVGAFFARIADLLEIAGESAFKTRAYRNAADLFAGMAEPAARLVREGGVTRLLQIPGVGKSIGPQTAEFVETGTSSYFEQLRTEVPETVADLLHVRGIGPKTASVLYRDFGILGLEDLAQFAGGGGLEIVPGIAERAAERLVPAIRKAAALPSLDRARALEIAASVIGAVSPLVESAVAVGGVRRLLDSVTAVEVLAITVDGSPAVRAFGELSEGTLNVAARTRAERRLASGVAIVLYCAAPGEAVCALVRTTGTARHVRELEDAARARGLAFRGYALLEGEGKSARPVAIGSEREFYERLALPYVEPERRNGTGELDAVESRGPRLAPEIPEVPGA